MGAINMLFHVEALPITDAIKNYLAMLKEAASAIATGMKV